MTSENPFQMLTTVSGGVSNLHPFWNSTPKNFSPAPGPVTIVKSRIFVTPISDVILVMTSCGWCQKMHRPQGCPHKLCSCRWPCWLGRSTENKKWWFLGKKGAGVLKWKKGGSFSPGNFEVLEEKVNFDQNFAQKFFCAPRPIQHD